MPEPRSFTIRHLASGNVGLLRGLAAVFGDAFDDKEAYAGAPPPSGD
jgi:hypothetical protein